MSGVTTPSPAIGGRRRWRLRRPAPHARLDGAYPELIERLLANRGVRTVAEAATFFGGPYPSDPFALPNMTKAVELVAAAIGDGRLIAVFGDFDVDGVTSTALLTEGLEALGGRATPYLPDRFSEGYGLNNNAVEELHRRGASLLITVDCGTSSVVEIELARRLGMEVVVVDHHRVPERLPPASALVNPHLPDHTGPNDGLAAVGLSYQLLRAVHAGAGRPFAAERWLDLVALGTVADMAPLRGENRDLVRDGLAALAKTERPGVRALMAVAGVDGDTIDSEALAFGLGPRLNAAGRLSHSRLAFDLLTAQDDEKASELARHLDELNRARRAQTLEAVATARELLAADPTDAPLVMLGHPSFGAGIVGLIAARLAQDLHRPAVVYEEGERTSRASARSVPEFDIVAALRSCGDLFERFGGHRQAAGFTAANERLPAIKGALQRYAASALDGVELAPSLSVDAVVPLSALHGDEIRWLTRFEPHGIGNPRPAFLSRGVTVAEARPIGAEGAGHLRLKLRDGAVTWPAIAFNLTNGDADGVESLTSAPQPGSCVDIVYSFALDRAGGGQLELRIEDLAPAGSPQS